MSSFERIIRRYYLFTEPDSPNQENTVSGTGAFSLTEPSATYWPFELLNLFIPPTIRKILEDYALLDEPTIVLFARAVFPCKFQFDVISYDIKRVDTWYDGVLRAKFGSVSYLSYTDFIDHTPIGHEGLCRDFWETASIITQSPTFTDIQQVGYSGEDYYKFWKHRFPTHIAYRLVPSVVLKVRTWWLWEITVADIDLP